MRFSSNFTHSVPFGAPRTATFLRSGFAQRGPPELSQLELRSPFLLSTWLLPELSRLNPQSCSSLYRLNLAARYLALRRLSLPRLSFVCCRALQSSVSLSLRRVASLFLFVSCSFRLARHHSSPTQQSPQPLPRGASESLPPSRSAASAFFSRRWTACEGAAGGPGVWELLWGGRQLGLRRGRRDETSRAQDGRRPRARTSHPQRHQGSLAGVRVEHLSWEARGQRETQELI